MSSQSKTKADLRKEYKERRKALGGEAREALSKAIAERFISEIPLWGQERVFVYLPIERFAEINTYLLIDALRERYPVLQWVLSRTNTADGSMQTIRWTSDTRIETTDWGIPEPIGGVEVSPGDIDLAIIPLLAYDQQGQRVGYGKGMYDRFLASCRPGMRRIGLSFFSAEEAIADAGEHDIPLHACITPEQAIFF